MYFFEGKFWGKRGREVDENEQKNQKAFFFGQ